MKDLTLLELNKKREEYSQRLLNLNPLYITRALSLLEKRRKAIDNNIEFEGSSEDSNAATLEVFQLMSEYENEIRQIFIRNTEYLAHITDVSPEKLVGGIISKSINKENTFKTEKGDWVFASSIPIDGTNAFIARKPSNGVIKIAPNIYIYSGDDIYIHINEQGVTKVLLHQPNYIYIISPEKFRPVVTLIRDFSGKPFFEFSGEWVSREDININDRNQVLGVKEIYDITKVVENYQILCDINNQGIGLKIKNSSNPIQALIEAIKDGSLRYINRRS